MKKHTTKNIKKTLTGLTVVLSTLTAHNTYAAVPYIFTNDDPADAAHVNENFSYLDNRVTDLADQLNNNDTTVDVNCGAGESLTDALVNAPASGHLTVNITGVCNERVIITRSNTAIVGGYTGYANGTDDTTTGLWDIAYADTPLSSYHQSLPNADELDQLTGSLNIVGAKNVVLKGIEPNSYSSGSQISLNILSDSSVVLKDSYVVGGSIIVNSSRLAASNAFSGFNVGQQSVYADNGASVIWDNSWLYNDRSLHLDEFLGLRIYNNSTFIITWGNSLDGSVAVDIDLNNGSQLQVKEGLWRAIGAIRIGADSRIDFQ